MQWNMTENDVINLAKLNTELASISDDNPNCKLSNYSVSYWCEINHIMTDEEVESLAKDIISEWLS